MKFKHFESNITRLFDYIKVRNSKFRLKIFYWLMLAVLGKYSIKFLTFKNV